LVQAELSYSKNLDQKNRAIVSFLGLPQAQSEIWSNLTSLRQENLAPPS